MRESMIGLDNCQNFIEICKKNGLNVIYGDLTELPFENNSADGIISIASFHHLDSEERRLKALYEMKRVIKPNRQILLSIWSKEQPEKTKRVFDNYGIQIVPWKTKTKIINRYYYIFRIEEIKSLFKKTGFNIISHTYEYGNEVFILEG
jgi:ubiquinone/menaquinone biosynthesis C-methylase UbiE